MKALREVAPELVGVYREMAKVMGNINKAKSGG
jgi:hypothetical protein